MNRLLGIFCLLSALALEACTSSPTLWRSALVEGLPACTSSCSITVTIEQSQERNASGADGADTFAVGVGAGWR